MKYVKETQFYYSYFQFSITEGVNWFFINMQRKIYYNRFDVNEVKIMKLLGMGNEFVYAFEWV